MEDIRNLITWHYRGLECCLDLTTGKGCTYSIYDIGAVTKEKVIVLYGGGPEVLSKEQVQEKVDSYIKESKCKPVEHGCKYYMDSVESNHCPFAKSSCYDNCLFNSWSDREHIEAMHPLEREIADLQNQICDYENESEDKQNRLDRILSLVAEIERECI